MITMKADKRRGTSESFFMVFVIYEGKSMGILKFIPIEEESSDIKEKVLGYWTRRSGSFSASKSEEAGSSKAGLWQGELTGKLPDGAELSVLDVGCGAGYFEMILAPLGYKMTGIDLTPDMILEGKKNVQGCPGPAPELLVMDAEHLEFPDETFDVVISRNLTWTLPHPADAYREWFRVLKPGGVLLNYDAEYAKGFHHYDQAENLAHIHITDELTEECHRIYHMLSVSAFDRPEWDRQVLTEIGFRSVEIDPEVGDRLYAEKDAFYMPDRMFGIRAVK